MIHFFLQLVDDFFQSIDLFLQWLCQLVIIVPRVLINLTDWERSWGWVVFMNFSVLTVTDWTWNSFLNVNFWFFVNSRFPEILFLDKCLKFIDSILHYWYIIGDDFNSIPELIKKMLNFHSNSLLKNLQTLRILLFDFTDWPFFIVFIGFFILRRSLFPFILKLIHLHA